MKPLDRLQPLFLLLVAGSALRVRSEHVYCSVVEAQPQGTLVCDLAEKIGQLTVSPSHQYQLISRTAEYSNYFEVHSNRGQLSIATAIDREAIKHCREGPDRPCRLDLAVTFSRDRDDQTNMRLIDVVVTVEDINDNAPTFKEFRQPMLAQIREQDKSVRIQLPKAEDPDAGKNGSVVYSFPSDKQHLGDYQKFAVEEDRDSGRNPVLRVVGDIDLEGDDRMSNRIELLILASDEGTPPRVTNLTVVISVENTNDFDPVFEPGSKVHSLSVKENVTVNSVIFTVRATDRDEAASGTRPLSYTIRRSDPAAPFAINRLSGEIRLRSALNAEVKQDYSFDVEVSDNHRPEPRTAVMTVNVKVEDVNDNPPEIQVVPTSAKYRLSVLENRASAMIAIIDVYDKDMDHQNRQLDCDLARFNQQTDAFVLQADNRNDQGGLRYILKNSRPLDREAQPEYRLSLVCSDSSGLSTEKPFSVTVRDENDSPPSFPESVTRFSFPENRPANTVIGAVVAQDADEGSNAQTRYEVMESCASFLGIGERNGSLFSTVPFDRELNASLVCTVRAYDANRTDMSALTSVQIEISDLNDCRPVFRAENLTFLVPENHRPAVVGRVEATDADAGENGRLSYSLAQPSPAFRITPLGEILMVVSGSRGLNREQQSSYSLRVRVQDHGQPPLMMETLVSIEVIDENDNSPRFVFPSSWNSSLNVSVHERPGTLVAKVTALDDDAGQNGQLTFGLDTRGAPGCDREMFRLDPESGHLLLAQTVPQSFADRVVCQLSIFVSDRGIEPRRSSQGLTVRFTGAQPRSSPGGSHGADSVGAGDVGAAGVPGRKGPRDLIVITVCVALSFLVLLCVVLLLAYFCYYLQMPALGAGHRDSRAQGRAVKHDGRGKLSGTRWLSRLGFGGRGNGTGAGPAAAAAAGRGTAVSSSFISPPLLQMKAPGVAGEDDDDEFGTAMPQCCAGRRVSAAATLCGPGQYRHPRGSDDSCQDDIRGAAAMMMPLYSEGIGGAGSDDIAACRHDYQTVAVDVARRRLNYLGVDSKIQSTTSYYKSLRPPSSDPAQRRRHQQPPGLAHDGEESSAVRMFQTVQYLVDTDGSGGGGRTAGALVAQQLDGGSRTAGGYVYGSPYLTSSFV